MPVYLLRNIFIYVAILFNAISSPRSFYCFFSGDNECNCSLSGSLSTCSLFLEHVIVVCEDKGHH